MSKKKRNKKYRPAEGASSDQPIIHKYVAEDEVKADRAKRVKRKSILYGIILAILALLYSWIF